MTEPEPVAHLIEELEVVNSKNVDLICPCGWKATDIGPKFIKSIVDRHLRLNVKELG